MDSESSGGGKTTLFIVVFFLCVISAVVGYFQFTMSSQQAEAEKKMKDIQAKAEADMTAAKSEEEKREIQRKADLELEQAKMKAQTDSERATMKAQTDAEKKALADREAKIKAAEAAVNKKLADAAATVKNAQNLQNQAKKVKADADKKNKDAAAAMAKAVASGKAVDKKLADEKKKLAADAKKKVDAANKAAATAKAQATAEAKKAIDLQKRLNAADAKLRGKNYERSGKYGAVPGYYRTGATWAGDHFNISDPNWCRNRARQLGVASWGHRNASHPTTKYKNSCYFYKTAGKYGGDGNDDIHMVGCAFGGNPKTGCRTPEMGFVGWNYQAKIDFPHNDRWYQTHSNGSYNRKRSLNRCASDKGCVGVTCRGDGKQCWGKNKLLNRKGHGDRYTWITKKGWK
jgi:hypothetical protein